MLMQATQKIDVYVHKDGGTALAGVNENTPDESGDNGNRQAKKVGKGGFWATLTGSTDKRRQHRVFKTNATHAWAVGRQILGLTMNYKLGGLGYKNGDSAYQDRIQREIEQVQDVSSIASSVAMGALYGSWGGPIGAFAGAVLNGASTTASIVVKYNNRERDFSVKLFKEYNGIEYLRARASINLTTGRLR